MGRVNYSGVVNTSYDRLPAAVRDELVEALGYALNPGPRQYIDRAAIVAAARRLLQELDRRGWMVRRCPSSASAR
jgi:hypothetical protein